ncbi:hypothetical protein CP533_5054 [Ophiocordyceps camponoti-saundersi (nom. inval.)]|nr:hypothetical protein CP533_5054 [Ophiocordyceps camponoti-saundersi (nom. inval.)]
MAWKASTLSAFTATPSFNEAKQQKIIKLREKTHDYILSRVPIDSSIWRKHERQLEESVVLQAVELKQALACSSIEYQIREPEEILRRQVSLRDARVPCKC